MTNILIRYIVLSFTLIAFSSCSYLSKFPLEKTSALKNKKYPNKFRVKWAKNLDPRQDTGNLPIALHSPLVYKGVLFAGDGEGRMRAYEVENGRTIWESQDNNYYHQKPIIYNDHVIYGTVEGRIYSRHYLTGKIKFEIDLDTAVESAGVVADGRLYFHLRNHKLFSLDAETGKILWAYRRSVPYLTTVQKVSKPLVVGKKLYIGFADGSIACFSVEDGNLLWDQKLSRGLKFVDVDATPVLFNDKLIVGSMAGKVSLLDANTGSILRNFPFSIARSPRVLEDGIYFVTTDGEMIRLKKDGREDLKASISKKSLGDFYIHGKKIYLGTLDGRFLELDRNNFKIMRTMNLGHQQSAIFGEIVGDNANLAFISSRYRLYVLGK